MKYTTKLATKTCSVCCYLKVKDLKMKSGGTNVMLHNCQLRKDV